MTSLIIFLSCCCFPCWILVNAVVASLSWFCHDVANIESVYDVTLFDDVVVVTVVVVSLNSYFTMTLYTILWILYYEKQTLKG